MQHENLQGQGIAETDYIMYSHNCNIIINSLLVPLYNGDTQESNMGENLRQAWNTNMYSKQQVVQCNTTT